MARSGLIYVANNNQILVRNQDGLLTVFTGTGKRGNTGDGGPAVDARVSAPAALALAPNGTLYFASGSLIRSVTPNGVIHTVAGGGRISIVHVQAVISARAVSFGPAESQIGLAVTRQGTLYLCPWGEHVFKLVNGQLRIVVTPEQLRGSDPNFSMDNQMDPVGIAFNGAGDLFLYCTDPYSVLVRVPSGVVRYVTGYRAGGTTDVFAPGRNDTLYIADKVGLEVWAMHPAVPARSTRKGVPGKVIVNASTRRAFPGHKWFWGDNGIAVTHGGQIILSGGLGGTGKGPTGALVEINPSDGHYALLPTHSR